jgi:dCMP deaminase
MAREEKEYVCDDCNKPLKRKSKKKSRDGKRRCKSCLGKKSNCDRRQKYAADGTSAHQVYAKDNIKYQIRNRDRYLKNTYGISLELFDVMLERQGGVCAICKQTEDDGKHLSVDHDHSTGDVRGLLCQKCNRAIGSLQDDISIIRSASLYLLRHNPAAGWDEYFLHLAQVVATRSKDPSTQVGAVIVRDRTIVATGYNGFPRGANDNIPERYDRPLKYTWMCHAEENALLNAAREGIKVEGGTIYVTPLSPCMRCARGIIQAGIKEVVYSQPTVNPRMNDELLSAIEMLTYGGVLVRKSEGIL